MDEEKGVARFVGGGVGLSTAEIERRDVDPSQIGIELWLVRHMAQFLRIESFAPDQSEDAARIAAV